MMIRAALSITYPLLHFDFVVFAVFEPDDIIGEVLFHCILCGAGIFGTVEEECAVLDTLQVGVDPYKAVFIEIGSLGSWLCEHGYSPFGFDWLLLVIILFGGVRLDLSQDRQNAHQTKEERERSVLFSGLPGRLKPSAGLEPALPISAGLFLFFALRANLDRFLQMRFGVLDQRYEELKFLFFLVERGAGIQDAFKGFVGHPLVFGLF